MKAVILTVLVASLMCSSLMAKIPERVANEAYVYGAFDQNKKANPDALNQCATDATHVQIFQFVGPFLTKLNKAGLADIQSVIDSITTFADSLPQSFKDCVAANPEIKALLKDSYGLDENTDLDALKNKLIRYATVHFLQVKGWIKSAEADWNTNKQYEKVGRDTATWAHSFLATPLTVGRIPERVANEAYVYGAFDQNKKKNPDSLNQCADDATHVQIFTFVGPFLTKLNKAGLADIQSVIDSITTFADSLPQSFKDCVAANPEIKALLKDSYGLDENTDLDALKNKLIRYATVHFLQVKGWIKSAEADWNTNKQYEKVGRDTATWAHSFLAATPNFTFLLQAIPQRVANEAFGFGVFDQNKHARPTTLYACTDDATHVKIFNFVGPFLDQLNKAGPSDISRLSNSVKTFLASLPESFKQCTTNNAELKSLVKEYGLDESSDLNALEQRIATYVATHFLTVKGWIKTADTQWNAGQYEQLGRNVAGWGHTVLKTNQEAIPTFTFLLQAIPQRVANEAFGFGVFDQNKHARPTTLYACTDDATHVKIFNFVGPFLDQLNKAGPSDISRLSNSVKTFLASLPESFKQCTTNNAELKSLVKEYGLDESSDLNALEQRIATYVATHFLTVKGWIKTADTQWNAGQYEQLGRNVAGWGHTVLKTNLGAIVIPTFTLLQQAIPERLANEAFGFGVFDQNKHARPTTLYACTDDATHVKIFNFVGPFLDELTKAGPSDISKITAQVQAFQDSLPESFKQCASSNPELKSLVKEYGLDESTDISALEKKIASYVTFHILTVKGWIKTADTQWNAGQYEQLGRNVAGWGHQVLKTNQGGFLPVVE